MWIFEKNSNFRDATSDIQWIKSIMIFVQSFQIQPLDFFFLLRQIIFLKKLYVCQSGALCLYIYKRKNGGLARTVF